MGDFPRKYERGFPTQNRTFSHHLNLAPPKAAAAHSPMDCASSTPPSNQQPIQLPLPADVDERADEKLVEHADPIAPSRESDGASSLIDSTETLIRICKVSSYHPSTEHGVFDWEREDNAEYFRFSEVAASADLFISHAWNDWLYTGIVSKERFMYYKGHSFYYSLSHFLDVHGYRPKSYWLDRVCILQTDDVMKAQATEQFEFIMSRCKYVAIIFSPIYLKRLWCLYEFVCALSTKDFDCIDLSKFFFNKTDTSKDTSDTSHLFIESVRELSVKTAGCKVEADRLILERKVLQFYISIAAFERFAQISIIFLVFVSDVLRGNGVNSNRDFESHAVPWVSLCKDLGFDAFHSALISVNFVKEFKLCGTVLAERKANWKGKVKVFVNELFLPLLSAERALCRLPVEL